MVDLTLDPKFWTCVPFPGSQRKLGLGTSLGEQEILQAIHLKKVGHQTRPSLKSNKPFVGFQHMLQLDIWYLILPNSWVYTWNLPDMFRMSGPFCIWYVSCELKGTTFYFHTISERSRYIFQLWRISLCSGGFFGWILHRVILVVQVGWKILGEAQALRMVIPLRLQFPDLRGNRILKAPKSHPWLVVSNIFYFHSYLGKIPILTNIFQRGWNHQLDP